MKVSINETVEVTDEQRSMIADILDSEKTKRQASRDEIKAFVWALGSSWEQGLNTEWRSEFDNTVELRPGLVSEEEMALVGSANMVTGESVQPAPAPDPLDCVLGLDDHYGCDCVIETSVEDMEGADLL